MKNILLITLLLASPLAYALKLQILHTNDLHSYFEGTRDGKGGYARLKTLIDQLREKGRTEGMKTLFVDGGDFGEGTSFFLADDGVTSLQMLDALGVDVSVVGNHDYLLGTDTLTRQIRDAGLKTKILSANMEKREKGFGDLIKDMVTFDYNGTKIGIFGLTTAEKHYKYAINDTAKIKNPTDLVKPMEKLAAQQKVDFLIALTHIGVTKDKEVAKKSKDIDLIVGGHSHTRLEQAVQQKNDKGRLIPIVQTGAHSMAIGEVIVDIDDKTKAHKVLSYHLHDVTRAVPEDAHVAELVQKAHALREEYLGRPFDEIIGETTFDLSGYVDGHNPEQATCWGGYLAEITRVSAKADVGIHIAQFEGERIPAGQIRYGDMLDNYPHFRTYGEDGWEIVTARMNGFVLRTIVKYIMGKPGQKGLSFAGITRTPNGSFKINGKGINWFKDYTIALPSEIAIAAEEMYPILKGILYRKRRFTGIYYWWAIEHYLRENSPLHCSSKLMRAEKNEGAGFFYKDP